MLTHDVPILLNYADAKAFAERTRPIRGTNGIIPLGERRYYHARKVKVEGEKIYVQTYSDHNVVCFEPNGNIHFYHGRWDLCNRQIICALFKSRFTTKYANATKYYLYDMVAHRQYPIHENKFITVNSNNDYKLVGEVEVETKPFVKRAVMRELRKEYAEFIDYAIAMNKLAGGEYTPDRDERMPIFVAAGKNSLLEAIRNKPLEGNEETYAKVFDYVVDIWSSHRWKFDGGMSIHHRKVNYLTEKNIKDGFTDYLKQLNKDKVFEIREVPNTTVVK